MLSPGQDRLKASPQVVLRNQSEVGFPESGLLCILPVHPTTSLLQLEVRPTGKGNGCVHPAMGEVQRLCKLPMVLGGQSPVASAVTASSSNSGGPCVEGPALVSSPAGDVIQLPTATSSHTEPVSVDMQCESNGSATLAGWLSGLSPEKIWTWRTFRGSYRAPSCFLEKQNIQSL